MPISAAGPTEQNLVFVGIAASPALAMLFGSVSEHVSVTRWERTLFTLMAVCNLVIAPLLLPVKCLATLGIEYFGKQANRSLSAEPKIATRTLVLVSTPTEAHLYFVRKLREATGIPHPQRTRVLVSTSATVSVTRLDARTLRVSPKGGYFATPMQTMYNDPTRSLREGDLISLSDMTARIVEVNADGCPSSVDFRFSSALESPEWLWMRGEGLRVVTWQVPRIGETVLVKPAS